MSTQRECLPTALQECPSNLSTRFPRVSHTSVLQERFGLFKKSLLRICQQIFTECLISVANLRKVHPKKVVRNPQYIGKLILGLHFTMFHPIFHPLQSCPTWLKSLVRSVRSSQSIKVLVPGLRSSSSIFKNLGWNSLSYLHGKTQLWNESSTFGAPGP